MVDRYTKIAIFLPIKDTIDIVEIVELLYRKVELRYYSFIKRKMSTTFYPQIDG